MLILFVDDVLVLGRKIARNVIAMATGEAPAEVATAETPEIVKAALEAVRSFFFFFLLVKILSSSFNNIIIWLGWSVGQS